MRFSRLLVVGLSMAFPMAAGADVQDAVNWSRMQGCNASGTSAHVGPAPLQKNLKLQKAAGRLANGGALKDALAAFGYIASESAELHFSGIMTDAQMTATLTTNYCATLTDPKLREMGTQRRGREVWVVLAAPVPIPSAADAASIGRQILDMVNAARAAGRRCGAKYFAPVAPLALNVSLTSAALAHSREMAKTADFDHRGPDGSTPADRIKKAGYGGFRIVGENIAAGAMTPAEVTEGWFASAAHCENIMDGRFTQIGIAYAANLDTAARLYWTQDFAAPR